MDFESALTAVAGFLVRNLDIISLIVDLIENKGVDKQALVDAMNKVATEASDAEMSAEFPKG